MAFDPKAAPDLGRLDVGPGNRQDTLDGGRVGGMAIGVCRREPAPNRSPGHRNRSRGHGPRVGDVDVAAECDEERLVAASMFGEAGDEGDHITIRDVTEQGQNLVTNAVAGEPWRLVGRIDDRLDPDGFTERCSLDSPQPEQGVELDIDARHPGEPTPPDEMPEHRLGLIVEGVAGEGELTDRGATCLAAPCFKIGSVVEFEPFRTELTPESKGQGLDCLGLGGPGGAQTVVDVDHLDREPVRNREHHQCGRVGSTADPTRHRRG